MKPLILIFFFCISAIAHASIEYSIGFTGYHPNISGLHSLRLPGYYYSENEWDFVPSYEVSILINERYSLNVGYLDYPTLNGMGDYFLEINNNQGEGVSLPAFMIYSTEEKVDEYFLSLGRRWTIAEVFYLEPSLGCSVFDTFVKTDYLSRNYTDVVPFANLKLGYEYSAHLRFFLSMKYLEPEDRELFMLGAGINYTF